MSSFNLYNFHNNPDELVHYSESKEIPHFVLQEVEDSKNLSVLLWKDRERIERTLAKDAYSSYKYAQIILKRFPAGEPTIMKHPKYAVRYAERIINGRFPEAEKYIVKDPRWAFRYAREVLKERWPEAEPYIQQDASAWQWYTAIWNSAIRDEDSSTYTVPGRE